MKKSATHAITQCKLMTTPDAVELLSNDREDEEKKLYQGLELNEGAGVALEIVGSVDEDNLGEYYRAMKVIEYHPDAASSWGKVQEMPLEYQRVFLDLLEANPTANTQSILLSLEEKFGKEQRPFPNDDANNALAEARTISPEAAAEFQEVYTLLQGTVPASDILKKIEVRFGPTELTKRRIEEERELDRRERERLKAKPLNRERLNQKQAELELAEDKALQSKNRKAERVWTGASMPFFLSKLSALPIMVFSLLICLFILAILG